MSHRVTSHRAARPRALFVSRGLLMRSHLRAAVPGAPSYAGDAEPVTDMGSKSLGYLLPGPLERSLQPFGPESRALGRGVVCLSRLSVCLSVSLSLTHTQAHSLSRPQQR